MSLLSFAPSLLEEERTADLSWSFRTSLYKPGKVNKAIKSKGLQ